jgi:mono/diheme cytochrome c family protein
MRTAIAALVLLAATPAFAQQTDPQIHRGRYLIKIGGCNDCHTAGYAPTGGKVPEAQWLTGDILGFNGPWGTTYPTNLRLYFQDMAEAEWLKKGRSLSSRPPMPWFNVRAMSASDLRAMYRYVRSLGPAGKPAPAYLPPDKTPPEPVVRFPAPPK